PIDLSKAVVLNAVIAFGVGVLAASRRSHLLRDGYLIAALKFGFAAVGTFWWITDVKNQFAYLLPWVWLVVVPRGNETKFSQRESFPRVLLCLATAWQSLQAYPIAGTQLTLATLLLVLAFGVCLSDALTVLSHTFR